MILNMNSGRVAKTSMVWLLLLSLISCSSLTGAAQETTPSATPETSDAFPRFAIVPVGDHPDGFIKDVPVRPGEVLQLTVRLDNFGIIPVDIHTFKVNALSAVNGGFASGQESDPPIGATEWLEYPNDRFELQPGEQKEVVIRVSVPETAVAGQYITGLMAQTAEPIAIPGSDILDQVIGYAMSVSFVVEGDLTHSFELDQPEVVGHEILIPVTNTGNYLVRPQGDLVLEDAAGNVILTSSVQMGSVYAGDATWISVGLPDQMAAGDYTIGLSLRDEPSGASSNIEGATVTVDEPDDPTGISVIDASIEPNAEDIVFANVDITLDNGGQQIPASNVTLEVMRNGEQVDSFPLATNQVLLNGENPFATRYLPADMWQSGEYTFSIKVSAVDPNGGQETILLDEELDATIVVP